MNLSRLMSGVVGIFSYRISGALPKPTIFAVILLAYLLIFINTSSQAQTEIKLAGLILDEYDGRPISQAEIQIENTNFIALSNDAGYFQFENIPNGYCRLFIQAEGYYDLESSEFEVVADVTSKVTMKLRRKIYYIGGVDVKGQITASVFSNIIILDRAEIAQSNPGSLSNLLNKVEGVSVQESGVSGSKRVSIRGCDPKHVLVLMDGHPLGTSGSGTADLSIIPLEIIEKIEIYKGGMSAQFGADALGGAINIITHKIGAGYKPEAIFRHNWGKWNTKQAEISIIDFLPYNGFSTKLNYSSFQTNGDFHYKYSVHPNPIVDEDDRQNADMVKDNLFLSGQYDINGSSIISFSGQFYKSRNGLPGPVSHKSITTFKEDLRYFGNFHYETSFSSSRILKLSMGLSRQELYYNNLEAGTASQFESKSLNDIINFDALHTIVLFNGNKLNLGLSAKHEQVNHDDLKNPKNSMGKTNRDASGVFTSVRQIIPLNKIPILNDLSFDASLRWDNINIKNNKYENLSKKLGLSISIGGKLHMLLRGDIGSSYRLPSVNAFFWKDVMAEGNPLLKPERSNHNQFGVELSYDGPISFSAGITYYHSDIYQMIIWGPTSPGNIWKPENVAMARITGHDDFIKISLLNNIVKLSYRNTILTPKNRTKADANYYNKDLIYRPRYTTSFECQISYRAIFYGYEIRLVDWRFPLESNTKWYPEYRIDNCYVGLKKDFSSLSLELSGRIKNLNKENYVLAGGFPMPRKSWSVGLSISWKFMKNDNDASYLGGEK